MGRTREHHVLNADQIQKRNFILTQSRSSNLFLTFQASYSSLRCSRGFLNLWQMSLWLEYDLLPTLYPWMGRGARSLGVRDGNEQYSLFREVVSYVRNPRRDGLVEESYNI